MSKNLISFIRLTRPLFLLGGCVLYLLGVLIALADGYSFNVRNFIIGQVLITLIQLMTHYVNEYYDLDSDAINTSRTWFSGGSGVLTSGQLSPRVAWYTAIILGITALVILGVIGLEAPAVAGIGAAGLFLAWFYSAPPLRLCARGIGELSASVVVAILVPVVGYSLQAGGSISPKLLVLCIPLFLMHFAMLIAFQIPDYPADLAAGKKTLLVRLGFPRTVRLHNWLLLLAYGTISLLIFSGWTGAEILLLPLPLAIWQSISLNRTINKESIRFFGVTLRAIMIFAATATLYLFSTFLIIK